MKRFLMTLLAVTMVFAMTAPAMAAKKLTKIKKEMCLSMTGDGSGPYFFMGFKAQKAIRVYGEKTKPYLVTGMTNVNSGALMPLTGNAYILDPETHDFVAVMTSDFIVFWSYELYWNAANRMGGIYIWDSGSGMETYYPIYEVDCKTGEPMPPIVP